MTAIDRTAYPRFKTHPSTKELAELYTPTPEEITFAQTQVSNHSGVLCLLVMLKSFQRLGYFPHPDLVPTPVIRHLRSYLKFPSWVSAIPSLRTRRRYEQAVRAYLAVKSYDLVGQQLAATVIAQAAEVMDHPADLINVVIEELVGYGCNLGPNQTARHTRGLVTSHMLSYTNRRHMNADKLQAAIRVHHQRLQSPEFT